MYDIKSGRAGITENKIMRLAFHDCIKYAGILNKAFSIRSGFLVQMEQEGVMDASTGRGLGPESLTIMTKLTNTSFLLLETQITMGFRMLSWLWRRSTQILTGHFRCVHLT